MTHVVNDRLIAEEKLKDTIARQSCVLRVVNFLRTSFNVSQNIAMASK